MNTLKFICAILFHVRKFGSLWVCNGYQEIEVHTCFTPHEVYVNFGEVCPSHGCGAGQDCFDVKIVPGGFVLFCNVKSNRRRIKWLAIK